MWIAIITILTWVVCAVSGAKEAFGMQQRDETARISLDGEWMIRPDPQDVGLKADWAGAALDGDGWKPIRVPGLWDAALPPEYDGVAWYHRDFELPPRLDGRRFGMRFLGVDDEATIFVNGVRVAHQPHYDRRFAFDVDDAVRPGRNVLRVRVLDRGGPGGLLRSVELAQYVDLEELQRGELYGRPARTSHDWVRDAVIYEVYLRSFSNEGSLRAVETRLDELQALGVTVLWLMPIHPVGAERRKGSLGSPYAVKDYFAINPEFGTLDDLKSLLRAVHARGMKLIIDLVANHTAWDNALVREHPDWFLRDAQGRIRPPVDDWSDVAALDYSKPEVRRYMEGVLLYWVRDVGIDGFRCDVAGMVPRDFWESVVPRLEAIRPVMMLAEDDGPAQHLKAFDITYDWNTYAALEPLSSGMLTAAALRDVLRQERLEFPTGSLRLRFSCNHDKNAWVLPAQTRYGPAAAKAAAVLTFVLPGVPLIYNGQEVGNSRVLSLFEKVEIDWKQDDTGLRTHYATLARLRREHAALRRGEARLLEAGLDPQVFGICRAFENEQVYAFINLANEPRRISGAAPSGAEWVFGSGPSGPEDHTLPAFGFAIAVVSR